MNSKTLLRQRRHKRIAAKMQGTKDKPRAIVFRSNAHISVQLMDDTTGKILCSYTDLSDKNMKGTKTEKAKAVGLAAGKKAKEQGIERLAFDRAGYRFHGRVKALAEGLKEAGLQF